MNVKTPPRGRATSVQLFRCVCLRGSDKVKVKKDIPSDSDLQRRYDTLRRSIKCRFNFFFSLTR